MRRAIKAGAATRAATSIASPMGPSSVAPSGSSAPGSPKVTRTASSAVLPQESVTLRTTVTREGVVRTTSNESPSPSTDPSPPTSHSYDAIALSSTLPDAERSAVLPGPTKMSAPADAIGGDESGTQSAENTSEK